VICGRHLSLPTAAACPGRDAEQGVRMLDDRWNGSWFALQVRARHENNIALALQQKAYEVFLPQYERDTGQSRRQTRVLSPLFPGYLFCRFDLRAPARMITTPGVIRIVGIGNRPVAVSEGEIRVIQDIIRSGLPTEPWPYLRPGERIRIVRGPLAGLEGILAQCKGRSRFVVSVILLQRSVAVEIEPASIVPLSDRSDRLWPHAA